MLRPNDLNNEVIAAQKSINRIENAETGAALVDSVVSTTIYSLFVTESSRFFLENFGKFILFPIFPLVILFYAIFDWKKAYKEKKKRGSWLSNALANAIINTISIFVMGGAILGALLFATMFVTLTPLIFFCTAVIKTLFNFANMMFYWGKTNLVALQIANMQDQHIIHDLQAEHEKNKKLLIQYAIKTIIGIIAAAATLLVFVLQKFSFAAVGIIAGAVGATLIIYSAVKKYRENKKAKAEKVDEAFVAENEQVPLLENKIENELGQQKEPVMITASRAAKKTLQTRAREKKEGKVSKVSLLNESPSIKRSTSAPMGAFRQVKNN